VEDFLLSIVVFVGSTDDDDCDRDDSRSCFDDAVLVFVVFVVAVDDDVSEPSTTEMRSLIEHTMVNKDNIIIAVLVMHGRRRRENDDDRLETS
jgi:hypothetical protein